jgi:hypothetical protein
MDIAWLLNRTDELCDEIDRLRADKELVAIRENWKRTAWVDAQQRIRDLEAVAEAAREWDASVDAILASPGPWGLLRTDQSRTNQQGVKEALARLDALSDLAASPPIGTAKSSLPTDPATEEVLAELSSLREWALKVCAAGEAFDRKAHAYNGADGFISGYYMPTGAWHRILGLIRSCPFDPALESEWRNPRLEGERLVEHSE